MAKRYVPERGDLVWLQFDPPTGHEQAGKRPALVISPSAYNGRVGLALLCPVTSQRKGYPFEVALPPGLKIQGVVLLAGVVQPDGRVTDIRVIRSLDRVFGLDMKAIEAARKWEFFPGTRFGEPVPVLVNFELTFNLR